MSENKNTKHSLVSYKNEQDVGNIVAACVIGGVVGTTGGAVAAASIAGAGLMGGVFTVAGIVACPLCVALPTAAGAVGMSVAKLWVTETTTSLLQQARENLKNTHGCAEGQILRITNIANEKLLQGQCVTYVPPEQCFDKLKVFLKDLQDVNKEQTSIEIELDCGVLRYSGVEGIEINLF